MGLTICKLNDLSEIKYKNNTLKYIPIKYLGDGTKTPVEICIQEFSYFNGHLRRDKKFVPTKIINVNLTDKIWKKYNKWKAVDPRIYTKLTRLKTRHRFIFDDKLKTLCEIYNQIDYFNATHTCDGYSLHFAKPIIAKIRENPLPMKLFDFSEYLQPDTEVILMPNVSKKTKLTKNPIISAFSHFSYHNSNGKYLICPVKGEIDGNEFYLAEPNVHKLHNHGYGKSQYNLKNHGSVGIALFFSHHICTKICENFKKPAMSDEFREKIKTFAGPKYETDIHNMFILARQYSRKIYNNGQFCDADTLEYIINPPQSPKYYGSQYNDDMNSNQSNNYNSSLSVSYQDYRQNEIDRENNERKYQNDLWYMNNYDSNGRNYQNDPFACR